MTKSILLFFVVSVNLVSLKAQKVVNIINLYGEKFPAEKIHIHFDKEIYLPGETIWFKAYVFEENMPSQRSTNFYISLYNEKGKALQQKIYPLINSTADGYFDVPDTVKTNELICRAYTSWMLNFDTTFLYTKTIKIFAGSTAKDTVIKSDVTLHFFAEGGDIIEGERNTLAFKANYANGLPYDVSGKIKNQINGEIVTTIKSVHDGMGRFDIEQQPNEIYYAEWTDNNNKLQKTTLPAKKLTGVSLKVVQQKTKLYYNVVNKTTADTLYILGYMYQKIIYSAVLPLPYGGRQNGIIPLDSFPTGVLQLTVFNKQWQPVAERICFINNNNYSLAPAITQNEASTQKRGKNVIEITIPDTIPANMSLSITDADFNNEQGNNNMFTNMLLCGDIRGYIHKPAYYFSSTATTEVKEQLDLVMLTHGWRRYNWDDIIAEKMPTLNFAPDNYIGVYGQMSNDALSKIKKEETVNVIVKTKDSTTNYYFVKPDAKGLLKMQGLIFYDTAKIYYSFNKEKLYNNQLAFSTNNYTLVQPDKINNYGQYLIKDAIGTSPNTEILNPNTAQNKYYLANKENLLFNKEKTMQAVVVKSGGWRNWKNDPLLKMDEKYTSGMFSGGALGYSFDVLHDETAWGKLDIYNYLTNKIPGFSIGSYNIISGRNLFFGGKSVFVYIDEHEMNNNDLENLSVNQIAYIKLIPKFMGRGPDAGGEAINPALSIYLKKGNEILKDPSKVGDFSSIKIAGYSPTKVFYSPNYLMQKDITATDTRTTLLWQPYILTDKDNLKIPYTFYNNDFSKRIKIVLEGINEDGKLIHIEKIIE